MARHVKLLGPSVMKEIVIASILGLAAGGVWKKFQWSEKNKTREFYELYDNGGISVVVDE